MIAAGRNINVTLIFSLERHKEVMEAYVRGVERLVESGGDPATVHSVASFFVSRVDTEADKRLDAVGGHDELKGKLGIANAKIAYQNYLEVFSGTRWEALASKGATKQRCLWASTSPRNPEYRDVMYFEGLQLRRTPDPCAVVIFGASGDLTKKKLFPALYSLAFRRLLPDKFAIVGVARTEETDEEFKARMKEAVQEHGRDEFREDVWEMLTDGLRYISMDFADERGEDELAQTLSELDDERGTNGNRVYHLAIPPSVFPTVVDALGRRRSATGWTRLIIEKPFGRDLASARALNVEIQKHFTEDEVFRIDHYLGKETVQNMLALRFANGVFEPIWNRQFIDHIQITVAESIGIEGRAGYYEQAGAIRDIFQNHLLQLVAITAMEPPIDFTAASVRHEKVKVLRAMHTPGPKSVVRGQYGRGYIEGEEVPAYREEQGVDPNSMTETYVA